MVKQRVSQRGRKTGRQGQLKPNHLPNGGARGSPTNADLICLHTLPQTLEYRGSEQTNHEFHRKVKQQMKSSSQSELPG